MAGAQSWGQICGLFESPITLSTLLDELQLGVIILDPDLRVLYVNLAFEALSGFNREEVRGLPCRNILRSNLCIHHCPVKEAQADNALVKSTGNIINRERRKLSVCLDTTPLRDGDKRLVGFLETIEIVPERNEPADQFLSAQGFGQIVGRSPKMQEIYKVLPVFAQTDSSVLITGETGTGKDLVAEVIHEISDRNKGPFIKVNCGALPETLLESELFGHQKGAFTGAIANKPGRIRLANTGTLFLTEIGDLPLALQAKLLTFLDDKIVNPLGSTKGFQADVRMVAATNRLLENMVKEGLFRQDLLFRLNVVRIHLPPLRERGGDIELLLDHFLRLFADRFSKEIKGYSDKAHDLLLTYAYPGNVRELRNIVEYTVNICRAEEIAPDHLPVYMLEKKDFSSLERAPQTLLSQPMALDPAPDAAPYEGQEMNWPAIERQMILKALVQAKGKRSKASEILGWGRSTLWRKMKLHGIDRSG